MKKYDPYLLYAVTDPSYAQQIPLENLVEQAILGGVRCVQLRDKTASKQEFTDTAIRLKQVTDRYGVLLLLNDHVDIAKAIDAAGVHIGQSDMTLPEARAILGKDKIIGVSARTVGQAITAQKQGADYLGVGAVFGTSTKSDAKPLPMEVLRSICQAVSIPVVAIGGITAENAEKLKGCGISGAATVSGIFAMEDIQKASQNLRIIMEQVVE